MSRWLGPVLPGPAASATIAQHGKLHNCLPHRQARLLSVITGGEQEMLIGSTESHGHTHILSTTAPFFHADFVTLSALLRSCDLPQGELLHSHIIECELAHILFLQNLLLQMYGKYGAMDDASVLFGSMDQHDQYSWNFMLSAYTKNGKWMEALELYEQLRMEGVIPNEHIVSTVLSACDRHEALLQGRKIHASIVSSEVESIEAIGNALMNLYRNCDCVMDTWSIFCSMCQRSVISWSSMITAYSQHGHGKEAIVLWDRMQQESIAPNRATLVGILEACANQMALYRGKQIHSCLVHSLFGSDNMVLTSLVSMYGKCGAIELASRTFQKIPEQNIVSWTALIAGYAQHGHSKEALRSFEQMQKKGIVPNKITFVCILDAYGSKGDLDKAKEVHTRIKHSGFDSDIVVATAVVNMYGKCGSPWDARVMFDEMPVRNSISWNSMLSVYVQHGQSKQAFELFNLMLWKGEPPNKVTFITMISACALEEALPEGMWMHDQVVRHSYHSDIVVGNSLINLYSKCGRVELARNVFDRLRGRTVVSWSTMIAAYARHGHGKEVLPMLKRMRREGVPPNLTTFRVILSACSHAGLVDDAQACLNSMSEVYGLEPDTEHYDCVVDLLGRAGRLDDVEDMISKMPMQPSLISWMTLLGACSSQADVERGEVVANQVFELYPGCPVPYVILSNMYAEAGRDVDAERLLARMKGKGLMRKDECSYIDVNGMVHEFSIAGDQSDHPQAEAIRSELQRLVKLSDNEGIGLMSSQDTMEMDLKGHSICHHTERLAMAFSILRTSPGTASFIVKSVKMCPCCHAFLKCISKLCNRQITIIDACLFHRMQDGLCSCGA